VASRPASSQDETSPCTGRSSAYAKRRGLKVIAEGIETAGQADTVFMAGCGFAQGYLFGAAAGLTDIAVSATGR
jgi:EAL domain-containing protein (putative c-di-GMP-specific phosphodiesterase class I)